jgi:hypothetical protein
VVFEGEQLGGADRADVTTRDIIVLGALLAQQLPNDQGPDQAPGRLKAFFLCPGLNGNSRRRGAAR